MSPGVGEAGAAGPWTSLPGKECTAPFEATSRPPYALLQVARLEEWLSDVVRVAYVPKLNGMGGLRRRFGHVGCLNLGPPNLLPLSLFGETWRLERG